MGNLLRNQMEAQHFCLKWDNHQSNLLNGITSLLSDEQLCDVTIACDGINLKAHKLILSACSSFFHDLFVKNPCTHPILIIPNLKYVDIKILIDFIYCGQVNVTQNQLPAILKTAAYLKIKGLSDYCVQDIKTLSEVQSSNNMILTNDSSPLKSDDSQKSHPDFSSTTNIMDIHISNENPAIDTNSPFFAADSEDCVSSKNENKEPTIMTYFGDDSNSDSNTPLEHYASNLMEQTMITDNVFQVKSLIERQYETDESTYLESAGSQFSSDEPSFKDSSNTNEKSLLKFPLNCSNCNYLMTSLSDAQSHLNSNCNCRTSQFQCFLCPKLFIWPATLIKHFKEQHQGPGGTTKVTERFWYYCDVCNKPLLSKHALNLHKNKFHGDSFRPNSPESSNSAKRGRKQGTRVCRLCKRTFVSNSDYQAHMQEFHSKSIRESKSQSMETENESNSSQSSISVT